MIGFIVIFFFVLIFLSIVAAIFDGLLSLFRPPSETRNERYTPPAPPPQPKPIATIPQVQMVKVTNRDREEKLVWINEQLNIESNYSNVADLVSRRSIGSIGYSDLLKCREWRMKRLEILIRDQFTCQDCGRRGTSLDVHHKEYERDLLPWMYADSIYVSLCKSCHRSRHDNELIPVYKRLNGRLVETTTADMFCSRCCGSGYLPEFKHVEDGICFACRGDSVKSSIFEKGLKQLRRSELEGWQSDQYDQIRSMVLEIPTSQFNSSIKGLFTGTDLTVDEGGLMRRTCESCGKKVWSRTGVKICQDCISGKGKSKERTGTVSNTANQSPRKGTESTVKKVGYCSNCNKKLRGNIYKKYCTECYRKGYS
jgi:5-methylcytosine-specific restriction endonuclease McrA